MNLTKIIACILVALAVALGLLALSLGLQSARKARQTPAAAPRVAEQPAARPEPQPVALHDVVVLARAVPAGQRLERADLKIEQARSPASGGFASLEEAAGRTTIVPLRASAPLLEQQLVNGLALHIAPGQRAVSVAVSETIAAGHRIRPGDFVDVFFSLDGKDEQTPVDTQARLLLARSRVLAYGGASVDNPPPTAAQLRDQQARQEAEGAGGRRGNASREDQGQRPENARTAVLAVPLEDVERLTLAEKHGQLTLALRHPDDLAAPDPGLFAALPPALQPAAGRLAKGASLQGADRAHAGLRFKDLASGADERNRKQAQPPRPPQARAAPPGPRLHDVELHNGASVQTVRY